MAAAGTRGFASCEFDGYFLILDRLSETLDQRFKEWKEQDWHIMNSLLHFGKMNLFQREFLVERLRVARDIASAIQYLHAYRIMFRDLVRTYN
jgi:hypothetical protein